MELLLIEVSCGYSVRQVSYYSVLFIIVVTKAIVFRSLISWLLLPENEGQNMHTDCYSPAPWLLDSSLKCKIIKLYLTCLKGPI